MENIVIDIKQMYEVEVSAHKTYKVKRKLFESAGGGDHVQSFKDLWDYTHIIKQHMLGALAMLQVTKSGTHVGKCRFQRRVISFPGLKDGFKVDCRLFISLDGCHLKGTFEGVLLSVVILDVNQEIFPLAICVYESKNIDSWTWFLGHLKEYLANSRELTFMTDRQKGILNALNLEFYESQNRCLKS